MNIDIAFRAPDNYGQSSRHSSWCMGVSVCGTEELQDEVRRCVRGKALMYNIHFMFRLRSLMIRRPSLEAPFLSASLIT